MQPSEYAPFLPEVRENPYPYYEMLREQAPVHLLEGMNTYVVSRYDDVQFVMKNPAIFSSKRAPERGMLRGVIDQLGPEMKKNFGTVNLINSDPPLHTRLRALVSRAFTPRRVADMEPRIRALSRELIAQLPGSGEFDLIHALAEPLPVIVISEMLGIEPERRHDFKRWSDDTVATGSVAFMGGDLTRIERSMVEMRIYLEGMIEARRKAPREDLISALVQGNEKEELLSPDDVISFCRLLLIAGNETTTNLLGNALNVLLRHPDQLERLTREPSLIPNAVEEVLRYDSPVQGFFRQVTQDVELAGSKIPAESNVFVLFGAANRDPRRFTDPERFDVTRDTQGQMAFGYGIHFCLGAPLARLEARVALEELLTPGRRLSFAEGQAEKVERIESFFLRGPKSLRLRTEPAAPARVAAAG